jgi:hypothetical protein
MGQIQQGILGSVQGKVGTVVGSKWKDKHYIRHVGTRSNKPATGNQQKQRDKMAVAVKFLRTLKKLLRISYRDHAGSMSGYNAAVRYLLKNCITEQFPDYGINYSRVLVSRGDLYSEAAVAKADPEAVTFTWKHVPMQGVAADDKAILVVYCEALNRSVFTITDVLRTANTATIPVARFKGYEVQTWLAFISANGEEVSDSVHAGQVTVT